MKTNSIAAPADNKTNLWWTLGVIALAVALTALSLYFVLHRGETAPARPASPHGEMTGAAPAAGESAGQPPEVKAMVERLAAKLEKEPNNGPGWQMLGRSYGTLGRFADAAKAYGRAVALLPPDASLLADYADVLAMNQAGNLAGEPLRMIKQALAIDPHHPKALALAGTEAFKRNDTKAALDYWHQAVAALPADSEMATSLRGAIADAEKRRGGGS